MLRELWEELFKDYPEIVTTQQISEMLGIGISSVCLMIHKRNIPHFVVHTAFLVPKDEIINHACSDFFYQYQYKPDYDYEKHCKVVPKKTGSKK